ncbi:MAG TPA: peptidylprolyl isomerase [Chthonomonadaceae bacterium]|nr:peptidylprolyl isomerase [Chthonomonadaceae bacterium]
MIRPLRARLRLSPALCAGLLALTLLPGCQGHLVIARINGEPILEDAFYDRLQHVTGNDLTQTTPGLDAGANVMVTMVQEKLLDQLASKSHAVPSDEWLSALASYYRRQQPGVAAELAAGPTRETTFLEQLKQQREALGIGTDGARVEPADVQSEYDQQKSQLRYPEMFTVNLLSSPTQAQAQQAYDVLKRSGDFAAAAQTLGQGQPAAPPRPVIIAVAPTGNQAVLFLTSQQQMPLPADYLAALRGLAPGQALMKPVTLNVPITQGAPPTSQTLYFVAKLISKQPSGAATLAEATPYLEQSILMQRFPNWRRHFLQQMVDFTHNSSVQINITRYRPLLSYIENLQQQQLASAISSEINPSPGGAPAGGPPSRSDLRARQPSGSTVAPGGKTPPGGR